MGAGNISNWNANGSISLGVTGIRHGESSNLGPGRGVHPNVDLAGSHRGSDSGLKTAGAATKINVAITHPITGIDVTKILSAFTASLGPDLTVFAIVTFCFDLCKG